MDVPQILLAVVSVIAGPAASIKVAALSAGRTMAELDKRLAAIDERVAALEETEPEDIAALRKGLAELTCLVGALRTTVDRLVVDLARLVADDEKRREKAAERAERRELREREEEKALAAQLAEVHTLLRTWQEERHARR